MADLDLPARHLTEQSRPHAGLLTQPADPGLRAFGAHKLVEHRAEPSKDRSGGRIGQQLGEALAQDAASTAAAPIGVLLSPRSRQAKTDLAPAQDAQETRSLTWFPSRDIAYGAVRLVSVVSHVAGRDLRDMLDAFLAGERAEALRLHLKLKPACEAIMGVASYGATTAKAALQRVGVLDNRRVRGPLVELDPDELDALPRGLQAAEL